MRHPSRCLMLVALLAVARVMAAANAARAVTVEDLARFAVIGDPQTLQEDYGPPEEAGIFSPDGKHVAVVVRRGNPEQGTNDGSLLVYRTSDLLRDPHGETVVQFASATNNQPLAHVRWLDDNETLVFAGARAEQDPQVYRVNARTRALVEVTRESAQLLWYDITPSGRRLVTTTRSRALRPDQDPACVRRGCLVTATSLFLAERGRVAWGGNVTVHDVDTGRSKPMPTPEMADQDIEYCDTELKGGISPDGRFGLQECYLKPRRWPGWWIAYTVDPELRPNLERGNNLYGRRMVLLDLDAGTSRPLTEAPWLWNQPPPIWIDGGRRMLLVGALEPLSDVNQQTRAMRVQTLAILLVDPQTRKSERVATLDPKVLEVASARWNERMQTLTVQARDAAQVALPVATYRRAGERWTILRNETAARSSRGAKSSAGVQLIVEQSLNDPPVLWAVDQKSGARKRILDPNPWLAELQLGRAEAITWKSKDGLPWRAGLYYPPNYQPRARYPLVIQTHGFFPEYFSLDGRARNFAGRALAAHDIVVLQVHESFGEQGQYLDTPQEWPTVQAGYESAIDHLDQLGVIDRKRVGIQGWSRTGPHVGYTLTHSSYEFAAAAFTDTGGHGYWWYLAVGGAAGGSGSSIAMEANYGASPYGEGLDVWRRFAPGFNFDRVGTPLLMWQKGSVSSMWDWYAGLRRLNKAVEYWFLPDGAHDVFKIGERMLTTQLLVDWFRFWLKSEEDRDPAKADQYSRWGRFREQQATGR